MISREDLEDIMAGNHEEIFVDSSTSIIVKEALDLMDKLEEAEKTILKLKKAMPHECDTCVHAEKRKEEFPCFRCSIDQNFFFSKYEFNEALLDDDEDDLPKE